MVTPGMMRPFAPSSIAARRMINMLPGQDNGKTHRYPRMAETEQEVRRQRFCIEGFGIEGIGVVCLGAHKGPGSRGAALKEGTSKGATKKSGFEWSVSERFATENSGRKGVWH